MKTPQIPQDEAERLAALRTLDILDTPAEERFDRVTRLARRLFRVPIALVSLVDANRQWFKSSQGLADSETPRDVSFCGHAILGNGVFLIPDARRDPRFSDNPLVTGEPHVVFYAGHPLKGPDGYILGTLCIIDHRPRDLGSDDLAALTDLGHIVEQELAAVHLATMDELTRVSNRRGFQALAHQAIETCRRAMRPATLLFFDLDHFKQINDRFGHAEGDRALVRFAGLLKTTFRESDVLGRISGDEFAVLFTNVGQGDVDAALCRFEQAIDADNRTNDCGYAIQYSVGGAHFDPVRHADVGHLIAEADRRMYEAKHRRRAPGVR